MTGSFLYGLFAILVLLPLAVFTFSWLLRYMDTRAGIGWKQAYERILETQPAVYFGCRLLAVAILIHAVINRFF